MFLFMYNICQSYMYHMIFSSARLLLVTPFFWWWSLFNFFLGFHWELFFYKKCSHTFPNIIPRTHQRFYQHIWTHESSESIPLIHMCPLLRIEYGSFFVLSLFHSRLGRDVTTFVSSTMCVGYATDYYSLSGRERKEDKDERWVKDIFQCLLPSLWAGRVHVATTDISLLTFLGK